MSLPSQSRKWWVEGHNFWHGHDSSSDVQWPEMPSSWLRLPRQGWQENRSCLQKLHFLPSLIFQVVVPGHQGDILYWSSQLWCVCHHSPGRGEWVVGDYFWHDHDSSSGVHWPEMPLSWVLAPEARMAVKQELSAKTTLSPPSDISSSCPTNRGNGLLPDGTQPLPEPILTYK